MTRIRYYYRLCEAEKLKQTYSSWINKKAHLGNGHFEILKRIIIKPKRTVKLQPPPENLFIVKFEFINAKKLDAWLFLKNNGLTSETFHSNEKETLKTQVNSSNP
jgi:hypothetical protein